MIVCLIGLGLLFLFLASSFLTITCWGTKFAEWPAMLIYPTLISGIMMTLIGAGMWIG